MQVSELNLWWVLFSFILCGRPDTRAYMTTGWRRQAGGGSVTLWAMFCSETLGLGIHMDVNLTCPTDLNTGPGNDGSGLFQHDNAPAEGLRNIMKSSGWLLGLQIPHRESNRVSAGCAGTRSLICGYSTWQLTGLKGSAAGYLRHLQRSCRVHALAGWSFVGVCKGPTAC